MKRFFIFLFWSPNVFCNVEDSVLAPSVFSNNIFSKSDIRLETQTPLYGVTLEYVLVGIFSFHFPLRICDCKNTLCSTWSTSIEGLHESTLLSSSIQQWVINILMVLSWMKGIAVDYVLKLKKQGGFVWQKQRWSGFQLL